MRRSLRDRFLRHRHALLLVTIVCALVTQPLVAHDSVAAKLAYDLLLAVAVVAMLAAVYSFAWERRVAVALALPAVVVAVAHYVEPSGALARQLVLYHLSVALLLAFSVAAIVRDLFGDREFEVDAVLGASAGYLILGAMWGSLLAMAELLAPGSFSFSADIRWQLDDWHLRRALFQYVSLATMAGLNYGDVTAVAPLTNTLSWLAAMSAQFYVAVVIAQIVGLKLAGAMRGGSRDKR